MTTSCIWFFLLSDYRRAAEVMSLATNLGGQTNMAGGLEEVEKMIQPPRAGNVRKTVVIVVSDWNPFNQTVRCEFNHLFENCPMYHLCYVA